MPQRGPTIRHTLPPVVKTSGNEPEVIWEKKRRRPTGRRPNSGALLVNPGRKI